MATKATNINGGMFESIALINAPVTKDMMKFLNGRTVKNILDKDQLILYAMIGLAGKKYYQSLHYAALSMSVDNEMMGYLHSLHRNYKV